MCADAIPEEVHAAFKRAAEAGAELLVVTVEAAVAYVQLDPRERPPAPEEAWRWVERIAEEWRVAEQSGGTLRMLVDEAGVDGVLALLGAIQDSLIVSLSPDQEVRREALPAEEVTGRVEELRQGGAFDGPVGPRERKARNRVSDQESERFEDLSDAVLATHGDNFGVYTRVNPDGRELDAEEASEMRERLHDTARAALAVDAEHELVAALADRRDLRSDLDVLRAIKQGFVLALSEDPERRAKAIPPGELSTLWRPTYERWKAELPPS